MIVSVGKSRELTKIRQQLASGQSGAALRRLQTLATVDPTDIDVHHLLVQIHRQRGDAAAAGRWGFLSAEATAEEIAAFERAHPSPWVRLRLLRWVGDPDTVPNPAGRGRLQALIALAEQTEDAPHIPVSRSPSMTEFWADANPALDDPGPGVDHLHNGQPPVDSPGPAAAPFGSAFRTGEPGVHHAEPHAEPVAAVPFTRRQLRKARRRAERLRRRDLRREVRASTWASLLMITILITLGVLGSLGAVRTMRSVIEHLASMIIN